MKWISTFSLSIFVAGILNEGKWLIIILLTAYDKMKVTFFQASPPQGQRKAV